MQKFCKKNPITQKFYFSLVKEALQYLINVVVLFKTNFCLK